MLLLCMSILPSIFLALRNEASAEALASYYKTRQERKGRETWRNTDKIYFRLYMIVDAARAVW